MNYPVSHICSIGLLIFCMVHPDAPRNEPLDPCILHQYTMAHYSVVKGDYSTAKNRYATLLHDQQLHRVPTYAYRGYIHYLNDAKDYQSIVRLLPTIEASYTNDPDISLLCAQALANVGKTQEASQKILALSTKFKEHPEIVFAAAQLYLDNKEPKNALNVIETLLNTPPHRGSDRIFSLMKAQIHMQLSEYQEALETVETCLNLYPTFDQGWLFYAMLQEHKTALDLAIKGYTHFLEYTDKPNKEIERHLVRLAVKKGVRDQHKQTMNVSHSCLQSAMNHFNNKNYTAALEAVDACLKQNPLHTDGRIMKIQILSATHHIPDAVQLLVRWSEETTASSLWLQLMHMLCHTGLSHDQAYAATTTITQHSPNNLFAHLYAAEYATRMHNYPQTITHCHNALSLTNDPKLKASIYFHMGMTHYRDGDLANAIKTLEQGAMLATNYAPLHNLLAYCYALHTQDIRKAEDHSKRALALEPDNPHYWDTHAVILYEKKEYKAAQDLLEKAHKKAPTNALILEHLAKSLYKQGNVVEAENALTRAQALAQFPQDKKRMDTLHQSWKAQPHAEKQ